MAKNVHLVFDCRSDRARARAFLTELGQQNIDLRVTGASKPESILDTQRPLVLTERMRAADIVVALISPNSAASKPMAEELGYARAAGKPVIGVLVGGATPHIAIPDGVDRRRLYGWDWGTLSRALA